MVHLHSNISNNNSNNDNYTSSNRNILRASSAISHAGPCFNQPDPEPL
ncbi:MAG TPA: hypothetical protein VFR95_12075 [Gemmatimonadaceae bacterium]|nr:hypothetical protein [Gemmatimonadaceae bacterium]